VHVDGPGASGDGRRRPAQLLQGETFPLSEADKHEAGRGARLSVEQGCLVCLAAEISFRYDPDRVFAEVLRSLPFVKGYREQFWGESFGCTARSADSDQVRTTLLHKTQDRIDYRGKGEAV